MRYIDGTRYISASEYAELKMISQGRVSQLKSKLPFEKFDDLGVELINFDKLELELDERQLMTIRYNSNSPIHQYTYKELGKFFSKLLGEMTRSTEDAINAKQIIEDEKDILKSEFFMLNQKHETLQQSLEEATLHNDELTEINEKQAQTIDEFETSTSQLEEQLQEWKEREEKTRKEKDQLGVAGAFDPKVTLMN